MTEDTNIITEVYDKLGESYDAEFLRPIDLVENDWTFRHLKRTLDAAPPTGAILDVGCGTGLVLENLRVSVSRYIGVDISKTMLTVAQRKFPHHTFVCSDVRDFQKPGFNGDAAAIVSTFASMSYVIDGHEGLAETFARWLQPGGQVFLQFFGRRYESTRSDFTTTVPFIHSTRKELIRMYSPYFDNLRVVGINLISDELPYKRWFALEAATLGRLFPDEGLFLVLTGTKKKLLE